MTKKLLFKTFDDEMYTKPPKGTYPSNKIFYNHTDEIWSIDLADMIDYKISIIKRFRCIFGIIDNLSKYLWGIPLKNKNCQTITDEFSNILATSKRSPLKVESDRGKEWFNSLFQIFLRGQNNHYYSRYTAKGSPICERVIRTIKILLKKPLFEKRKADWLIELPSVVKQN